MIFVKNLGWLGKQFGSSFNLDPNVVTDTYSLLSYLDLINKNFKFYLKQMYLNGVTYIVIINDKAYTTLEVLNNNIPINDNSVIEFVPYFKFNAGYYGGITGRELLHQDGAALYAPFTTHLLSWLRSNPVKLDDNDPYKEVFKQRQQDYKQIFEQAFAPKNNGDLFKDKSEVAIGKGIPLIYGKVKYSGRNLSKSVITNTAPVMDASTLAEFEQFYSAGYYLDTGTNKVGKNDKASWELLKTQLQQVLPVTLDISNLVRGSHNYQDFVHMIVDNPNLNMLTTVKDNNEAEVNYNSTEALRVQSKTEGKAFVDMFVGFFSKKHEARPLHFYDDESGAVLFFYLYQDLVKQIDDKFKKELIPSLSANKTKLTEILQDDNKLEIYRQKLNYLSRLTNEIFTYAKSVFNLADAANGQGGHLGKITDICQILIQVYGEAYLSRVLQSNLISTWWIVKHGGINYIANKTHWDRDTYSNESNNNLRDKVISYIDNFVNMKF